MLPCMPGLLLGGLAACLPAVLTAVLTADFVLLPVPPSLSRTPQDGRDFADVVSPKLAVMFDAAAGNRYYLRVLQHLVEGDTGAGRGKEGAAGTPSKRAPARLPVLSG